MSDVMQERLPNLIIAGLGKSGTTSLFWYLSQHPDICVSAVKEPRYFSSFRDEDGLPPLEGYARHFRHCTEQRYVLEASPQYFHGSTPTIVAIQQTLQQPRIIIVLRDPVDRMWSTYRFVKTRRDIPPSLTFDAFVAECEKVHEAGLPLTEENKFYWTLSGGFYLEHLREWLESFGDRLRIVFFEHLATDPVAVIVDLCRWLGIDDHYAPSFNYSVENRTVQYRSKLLHRVALAMNSERLLGSKRRLKAPLRGFYHAINRKAHREAMSEETKTRLQETFRAANDELAKELIARGYTDLPHWLTEVPEGLGPKAGNRLGSVNRDD
jgi:hypothetical protein